LDPITRFKSRLSTGNGALFYFTKDAQEIFVKNLSSNQNLCDFLLIEKLAPGENLTSIHSVQLHDFIFLFAGTDKGKLMMVGYKFGEYHVTFESAIQFSSQKAVAQITGDESTLIVQYVDKLWIWKIDKLSLFNFSNSQ